jgi:hypothetical protein
MVLPETQPSGQRRPAAQSYASLKKMSSANEEITQSGHKKAALASVADTHKADPG